MARLAGLFADETNRVRRTRLDALLRLTGRIRKPQRVGADGEQPWIRVGKEAEQGGAVLLSLPTRLLSACRPFASLSNASPLHEINRLWISANGAEPAKMNGFISSRCAAFFLEGLWDESRGSFGFAFS